jgi:fermentation-respiration switch protein FrsA (DUF1100 family)
MIVTIAALLVGGYVALVGALWAGQRNLLYLPDTSRPALAAGAAELRLRTEDGLDLLAWHFPGTPTIVYLHGNGGHLGYRTERFRRLAALGYGVLAVEYRGYGGNPGSPSEAGLYADGRAALAFVGERPYVLWGESLGGAVAAKLAAEKPPLALILESPFTRLADVASHHYWWVPVDLLLKDRFDVLDSLAEIRVPILVAHGRRDTVVPVRFGEAVFAAAREPKRGWFPASAGHNDLRDHGLIEIADEFLRPLR